MPTIIKLVWVLDLTIFNMGAYLTFKFDYENPFLEPTSTKPYNTSFRYLFITRYSLSKHKCTFKKKKKKLLEKKKVTTKKIYIKKALRICDKKVLAEECPDDQRFTVHVE